LVQPTVRVPLQQVADLIGIGQPLPFRVLDAPGRLLLNEGQVVASQAQFEALCERGAWAENDAVQAERRRREDGKGEAKPLHRETLFDHWERTVWDLEALVRRLAKGECREAPLREFARRHGALVDRDPDVALFMAMRQDDGRFALYPATHALCSATLCLFTARQLGWEAARVEALVLAALTMNASIVELQSEMAEQGEPPTPGQAKLIRAHPAKSAALLEAAGVRDEAWLAIVRDHHERQGGGGYPRGLAEVSDAARLLRSADVFMAKISPRAKRPAIVPQAAAREFFQQEKGGPIAGALIKAIGVHPPGSLVQLKGGEVAVVARRANGHGGALVATLTDAAGKPVTQTAHRDTGEAAHAIAAPHAGGKAVKRVFPERVYGLMEP
jgi:hypothetical protein